jgi:ATP-binding cassette, subfamily F, member 3
VLDEPTNHLDLDSREALEDALTGFPGSVLLVSHDRALLDAVGTRTVAYEDGGLRSYAGGWAEFARLREERKAAPPSPKPAAPAAAKPRPARNGGGPSKNQLRRQRDLEREIERAEAALVALEDELGAPGAWADPDASAASTERHADAKRTVEELYARYEALAT